MSAPKPSDAGATADSASAPTKYAWDAPSKVAAPVPANSSTSVQTGEDKSPAPQVNLAPSNVAANAKNDPATSGPSAPPTVATDSPPLAQAAPESASVETGPPIVAPKKHDLAGYDEMLTDRQKAILRERAQALSIDPKDYEHLLSEDEKERLDSLLSDRQPRVTTGE